MNIMYILHTPNIDGSSLSFLDMIDKMNGKKVKPYVILPGKGKMESELRRRKIDYDIYTYHWCVNQNNADFVKEKNLIGIYIKLIYLVLKWRIAIIESNSSVIDIGAVTALLTIRPHVWHFREFIDKGIKYHYGNNIKQKFLMRCANYIIATSKSLEIDIRNKYNVLNICTIYDGININKYKSNRKYILSSDNLQLIIVGNLSDNKGQLQAIEAMRLLKEKGYTNYKLKIIGSGENRYKNFLIRYIEKYELEHMVEIRNFTTEIVEEYKNADITLICSRSEGFGRTTVEAMLMHNFVIGADMCATNELIINGVTGLLYQYQNIEDLVNKIVMVNNNRIWAKNIILNGAEYAQRNYSDKIYVNNMMRIYNKI